MNKRVFLIAVGAAMVAAPAAAMAGSGLTMTTMPRGVLTTGATQVSIQSDLFCRTDPATVAIDFGAVRAGTPTKGTDDCEILVNAPAQAAGTVDLTATVPGSPAVTASREITYFEPPAALIGKARRARGVGGFKAFTLNVRALVASDFTVAILRPSGARIGMLAGSFVGGTTLTRTQTSVKVRALKAGDPFIVLPVLGRTAPRGMRLQVASAPIAPGITPSITFALPS